MNSNQTQFKLFLLENEETRNRLNNHMNQITNLTQATNNLNNDIAILNAQNVDLRGNLKNVTSTLNGKSTDLEVATNDLQNKTSLLFSSTEKLKQQGNRLDNLTADFQSTIYYLSNVAGVLSSKVESLERTSLDLTIKSNSLETFAFDLSSGRQIIIMGVGSGGQGSCPPWIFILGTDKVEGGLMVLFLILFFPLLPTSENFSADALANNTAY